MSGGARPYEIKIEGGTIENVGPFDNVVGDADGIAVQDFAGPIGLTIVGTTFRNCEKRALKIQCEGVTVTGVQIISTRGGTTATRGYSAISVYASNVTLAGITVKGGAWSYGIDVEAIAATGLIRNVTITGCTVKMDADADTSVASPFRAASNGAAIEGLTMSGNTAINCQWGMRLRGLVSHSTLADNIVIGAARHGVYLSGQGSSYPSFVTVSGTVLKSVLQFGVKVDGTSDNITISGTVGTGAWGRVNVDATVTNTVTGLDSNSVGSLVQGWRQVIDVAGTYAQARATDDGAILARTLSYRGQTSAPVLTEASPPSAYAVDAMIVTDISSLTGGWQVGAGLDVSGILRDANLGGLGYACEGPPGILLRGTIVSQNAVWYCC